MLWPSAAELWLRRGKGNGEFEPQRSFGIGGMFLRATSRTHPAVAWNDVDDDGHVDLVFAMSVLSGDGKGAFDRAERVRRQPAAHAVAAATSAATGAWTSSR